MIDKTAVRVAEAGLLPGSKLRMYVPAVTDQDRRVLAISRTVVYWSLLQTSHDQSLRQKQLVRVLCCTPKAVARDARKALMPHAQRTKAIDQPTHPRGLGSRLSLHARLPCTPHARIPYSVNTATLSLPSSPRAQCTCTCTFRFSPWMPLPSPPAPHSSQPSCKKVAETSGVAALSQAGPGAKGEG